MDLYLAADHKGFALKNKLRDWLQSTGNVVFDLGAAVLDPDDDYPDYALKVAQAVAEDADHRRGIVVCGSGVGMAVVADKVPGIRAGLIHDSVLAKAARNDDDINVIALGADFISDTEAKHAVEAWLATNFSGEERHKRRLKKISEIEKKYAP